MDIRLKNKSWFIYLLVIISMAFVLDYGERALENSQYLFSGGFFNTREFKTLISNRMYNIEMYYKRYKDFDIKSAEDKLTEEELQAIKEEYDNQLLDYKAQIERSYKEKINYSKETGSSSIDKLIEEKKIKIEDFEQKIIEEQKIAIERKVKELTDDYIRIKNAIEKRQDIKYYIKDSTDKIYTNINENENILTYINEKAIYSIKFPLDIKEYKKIADAKDRELLVTNLKFEELGWQGYFIVTKEGMEGQGQLREANIMYNDLRIKAVRDIAITLLFLILTVFIIKQIKEIKSVFIDRLRVLYEKIPVDVRMLISLIAIALIFDVIDNNLSFLRYQNFLPRDSAWEYIDYYDYYTKNIIDDYLKSFTFAIFLIGLYKLSFKDMLKLLVEKERFKDQWHRSITFITYTYLKDSLLIRNIFIKVFVLMLLTMFLPIAFIAVFEGDIATILGLMYITAYLSIVFTYVIKKIGLFNKILKASNEIVAGNLNYVIETKGDSSLSQLANNINNMKSGIKKSVENQMKSERLKTELITNVSHDLKTPLTSIINYVNLLKEDNLTKEETENYVEILDRKTQRLKILIEDLFEATKMSSGSVELNIDRVDIVALLNQALGEFDEKIKKSNLSFKVKLPKEKMYVNLDGKKTWRVFENLIGNILKYSQSGTRVYIEIFEEDGKVKVSMKNISAYEMDFSADEIFERFKRGDSSRHTEGSGLGLAIAKNIVEMQKGEISIDIDGDLFKVIVAFDKV